MNSRKINHFPDHLEVNLALKPLSPLVFPGPFSPLPLRNFQFPPWWGSGYFLGIHNARKGRIMKALSLNLTHLSGSKKRKKTKNTCLVVWMVFHAKLIRKINCVNIPQCFLLPLHKPVSRQQILCISTRTPQLLLHAQFQYHLTSLQS